MTRLERLVCRLVGHAWRHITDHRDLVLVYCTRCGQFPVWYPPKP